MGHYSDYYEEEYSKRRISQRNKLQTILSDLIGYTQYNACGKSTQWTFSEIGLEKEFDKFLDKIKAKLYDLGDHI